MQQPAHADALQATPTQQARKARDRYAWIAGAIVVAALGLRWPGLTAGLHSDDYVQDAMLSERFPAQRSVFALYDFGGRDAGEAARLRALGWFPWWSAPELRLAMFRPLSSLLVAGDHALAGSSSGLRHLHSAVWCVGLLLGVAAVFRRLLPEGTALLALALFAAEPALSVPLAWLANRNALVAMACGVWALYAYLRFRGDGASGGWGAAAAIGFGLAALAGEYALPLLVYVVVYEAVVAREPVAARLRCAALALAAPACVVAAGVALGYGPRASGLYVSPLLEPVRYASACLARVPVLAAELLCALPAPQPADGRTATALALGAALLAIAVLYGAVRSVRADSQSHLIFLGVSSLLGLPLLGGALPEARLLLPVALGSAGVIASVLVALVRRARGAAGVSGGGVRSSRAAQAFAAVLALVIAAVHLGVKPVQARHAAELLAARARGHSAWALRADPGDARTPEQEWIVLAARDFTTAQILPFARAFYGQPLPRAYRVLSIAPRPHALSRLDARTLELRVLGDPPRDAFAGSLHRPSTLPFAQGERARAGAIEVQVEQVDDGQPIRMRFHFPEPLDAPGYVFLYPQAAGLARIALPAVGASVRLPPPRAPRLPP